MDMIMLDVTDADCNVGDEVTLLGTGEGERQITVAQLARLAEMSPYEILTGLRARLNRHYTGG